MTPDEHRAEAERLLRKACGYRQSAGDPDAAGSDIRKGWARQADIFLAEAQVHATLAAPSTTGQENEHG